MRREFDVQSGRTMSVSGSPAQTSTRSPRRTVPSVRVVAPSSSTDTAAPRRIVDSPRQGGQRTADAQAATERIENSALPWRSNKRDPRRDLGLIKPGEDGAGIGHGRADVLACQRR